MSNWFTNISKGFLFQKNARFFKTALYLFVIIKCFLWLLEYNLLFGETPISYRHYSPTSWWQKPAFVLYYSDESWLALIFILLCLSISVFSIIKKSHIVSDLLLYLLCLNIHYKTYTCLTGGESFLQNFLFLSAFIRNRYPETNNNNNWAIVLHNLGFITLFIQICVIYLFASLAKWADSEWIRGNAIHLVNQAHHFSKDFLAKNASLIYPLSFLLNYIVLVYQTLFPLILFVKKHRNTLVWLGVAIHAYIAFVMGLFSFGFIMIISYSLFYRFKE